MRTFSQARLPGTPGAILGLFSTPHPVEICLLPLLQKACLDHLLLVAARPSKEDHAGLELQL
jgi:hypothetical protein